MADLPDVASPPISHQASRPTPQLLPTIHRWQPQISGKLGTISISASLPQSCPVGVNSQVLRAGSVLTVPEKAKPVQFAPVSRIGHFSSEGTFSHLYTDTVMLLIPWCIHDSTWSKKRSRFLGLVYQSIWFSANAHLGQKLINLDKHNFFGF